MIKVVIAATMALLLSACARTASLVSDNAIAYRDGAVDEVRFKAYGMGTGEVWMRLHNGETLSGRYQLDRDVNILTYNGALLAAVFGTGAVKQAGREIVNGAPVWSPGVVDVSSASGDTCHCDLMNNNFTGHGQGACKFADGAIYQLEY